jgi:hypothetical protein
MMDIIRTNAKIANLQLPNAKKITVEPAVKSLLGRKSDNYVMSVDYVSLLKCMSNCN